jgi:hypothetical protein
MRVLLQVLLLILSTQAFANDWEGMQKICGMEYPGGDACHQKMKEY